MTVAELIEELKQQPGDNELRFVDLRVLVQRPYAKDIEMHCNLSSVSLSHGEVILRAYGYIE